jgi:hypothetical protein
MNDDTKRGPNGFAVLTADGHFVGIWLSRETAEKVVNRSPSAKGERIVEYMPVPPARTEREEYARANPLGGPAKMFDAIAARLRAGEPFDEVMHDYGIVFADDTKREPVAREE